MQVVHKRLSAPAKSLLSMAKGRFWEQKGVKQLQGAIEQHVHSRDSLTDCSLLLLQNQISV